MKRVTMKDVARAVGVHISTVSRAIDPATSHQISPRVVARVRAACKRLNYSRNAAAYSLRVKRSRMIGVLVPDLTDPAIAPIIRGIEDSLSVHDYVAIVSNTDDDTRKATRIAEMMCSRGVEGMILASVRRKDSFVDQLAVSGLPLVTVNRRVENSAIPSVTHDEEDGMRRSVTHLVSLGHRRIAGIAGPQEFSTGYSRYRAFEQHCAKVGAEGPVVFASAFTEAEGDRCMEELLTGREPFTGLICANDRLAVGAIGALRRRGLTVPEYLSVTGFNDMPLVDRLHPPLTTVRLQHQRGGIEAAGLLMEMLQEPLHDASPRHVVLPVEFVIRASTQSIEITEEPPRSRKKRSEMA